MARLKTSGLISDIAGSVSGMTFQQSAAGLILRKKPIPLKIDSDSQHVQRNRISFLQSQWLQMSEVDRYKWKYFLSWSNQSQKHNQHLLLSGYQLYLKYQTARLLAGYSLLTDFTFEPLYGSPSFSSISVSGSTLYLVLIASPDSNRSCMNCFLSNIVRNGTSYRNSGLRFVPSVQYTPGYYSFLDNYQKIFGFLPLAGDQICFRFYFFNIYSPVLGFYLTGSTVILGT